MRYQSTYLNVNFQEYATIFAMDWSLLSDSEIAFKRKGKKNINQKRIASDIKVLTEFFKQFPGSKLIVFEDTTGAHWLYVELHDIFDRIIICDPYRNSLLKEGPKTDKIDAFKLLTLLMNNSLKEVFHNDSEIYAIRKFMSGYLDLDNAITRLKNQINAFKRAEGFKKNDKDYKPKDELGLFVYERQLSLLEAYEEKKSEYQVQMRRIIRRHPKARNLLTISGIGYVFALIIYSTVVEAERFRDKYRYYGYDGLVLYPVESGRTIHGKRKTHYNPRMKWLYKSAAQAAITGKNDIHDYYIFLLGKGYEAKKARNEIARYIARVSLAMLKNGTTYEPYSWRKNQMK